MQPNQQVPGQYDFILNPQQPKKPRVLGGGSMKSRLIMVAVLVVGVIIVISVVSSLLSRAGRGSADNLKAVAAQQAEIIRVADLGLKSAKSAEGRALAINVLYSVMTDQAKLNPLLETGGIELSETELASKKDPASDEKLTAGGANNRYDETLREVLTAYLYDYQGLLKTAYDGGVGPNTKTVLEASFNSVDAILGTTVAAE